MGGRWVAGCEQRNRFVGVAFTEHREHLGAGLRPVEVEQRGGCGPDGLVELVLRGAQRRGRRWQVGAGRRVPVHRLQTALDRRTVRGHRGHQDQRRSGAEHDDRLAGGEGFPVGGRRPRQTADIAGHRQNEPQAPGTDGPQPAEPQRKSLAVNSVRGVRPTGALPDLGDRLVGADEPSEPRITPSGECPRARRGSLAANHDAYVKE